MTPNRVFKVVHLFHRRCHSVTSDVAEPKRFRKVIVGLWNVGDEYKNTRHNIGAEAVKHFCDDYLSHHQKVSFEERSSMRGLLAKTLVEFGEASLHYGDDLIDRQSKRRKEKTLLEGVPYPLVDLSLLLPTTYMNRSGSSVRCFVDQHKWRLKGNHATIGPRDEILVASDDINLPFGRCIFKPKGSDGGQNGVADITKHLATEKYARLRIGIGSQNWMGKNGALNYSDINLSKYVLGKFNISEQEAMASYMTYITELLRVYLHRGLQSAMSIANVSDLNTYRKLLVQNRKTKQ